VDVQDPRQPGLDRRGAGVAGRRGGRRDFGSRDATLDALDEKTGAKRWATKEQKGSWIISSPAVVGRRVVYGTSDNHTVRAANADTGKIEWTNDAVGRVLASPIVVGDRVFVGLADSGAVWLDVATR
jgi:outer membrane protein assembly factor BamB